MLTTFPRNGKSFTACIAVWDARTLKGRDGAFRGPIEKRSPMSLPGAMRRKGMNPQCSSKIFLGIKYCSISTDATSGNISFSRKAGFSHEHHRCQPFEQPGHRRRPTRSRRVDPPSVQNPLRPPPTRHGPLWGAACRGSDFLRVVQANYEGRRSWRVFRV